MKHIERYLLIILLALLPVLMYAQAAGGQVKRPTPQKTKPKPAPIVQQHKPKQISMTAARRQQILDNLVNNMVYVEGGTFTMGALPGERSVKAHKVTLSSFYISKYEVMQEEWEAVMGNNPSKFYGDKLPVEKVSWNDCQEFIAKLNAMTGKHFRLPTEAEWEYAARGGNKSCNFKYAGSNTLDDVAWYNGNSGDKTHPVGQKLPNELGLYDMSGNVFEWCQDRDGSSGRNLQQKLSEYICRGGGWGTLNDYYCKVTDNSSEFSDVRWSLLGLRLVLQ